MGERINLNTAGMHCIGAYLAKPAGKPKGGVVVVQEIFGVNAHIRSVADGYAAHGYTAIAPAFFDFVENDVELAYDKAGIDKGRDLAMEVGLDRAIEAVASAAESIRSSGKVGVVGYCLGGSLAYACATNPGVATDASVGYYPVQIDDYLSYAGNIDKPALFHIAEKDGFCPPESQAKIKEALGKNPNCTVHSYAGVDHAFAREGGANFSAEAARLANERTAAFFKKNLG